MAQRYAFAGEGPLSGYVETRLGVAGWERVGNVEDVDVVVSYFSHASSLEDGYFDESGLVKRAVPGTLFVDLSSATPSLSREIAAVSTVCDLRYVEAPLSVIDVLDPSGFDAEGNVVCFLAGEDDDVEQAMPLLDALASEVKRTGSSGSAQLAKAMATVQMSAEVVGAVEADALFRSVVSNPHMRGELDPLCPIASGMAQRMRAAVAEKSYEGSYTVSMFMGDVVAAMSTADDIDLILPQLEAAFHLLELMAVIGGADKAVTALTLLYQDEEASAAEGLDWTRAEGLYGDSTHGSSDDGDEDDDFGFDDAFTGFSSN